MQDGARVAIVARAQSDLWRLDGVLNEVEIFHADLEDLSPLANPLREWKPKTVFHLGWFGVTGAERNDVRQISCNATGTLQLLQMAQQSGCRSFIGLGSQAEYGNHDGVLTEDLVPNPVTAYGVAKHGTRILAQKMCELADMRFAWLRLAASYGPQDDERHLIPAVIRQLLKGERPSLTAGEQKWDYLYIDDAVQAIALAASREIEGVYNLGSGRAVAVRHLVETIRDDINPDLPLGWGEVPYRPDQVMHLEADSSRLQKATGWMPQTSLEDGLNRTIEWCRDNAAR